MSDTIDINVNKIVENIDVVANFEHPNIEITTIENIDNVNINSTPNVVQININSISGDVEWGEIEGILSNQTDLQQAFDLKANNSDLGATAFSNDYNDLDNLPNIPSIDNLVPYAGATQNVDLGEHQIKAGQVEFDTTPTGNAGVGILRWNNSDGTLDLGLKGGNVTLQIGQEQVVRVVNKTGSNLLESNYQAVRVNGAQGQRLKVSLAQATNDLLSAETIGLVTETINNNQEGFVTTSGLIRGINTTGSLQGETWADGDMLYLSPFVAGRITNIKPSAPNHLIVVGYVVYSHANNGSIFVKVDNGYELEELHNVTETNYTTPIDTDSLLTFDVTNSLWKRLSWANIKSNLKTYFDAIYTTSSAVATQISSALVGYATQAWVTSQGYITNVITALGYTPENVANKATNLTSPNNTTYPTTQAVVDGLATKQNTLTNPITGTGANGQVAFFNGENTQTGDNGLFWDNTNKRLGVGTTTPTVPLEVNGRTFISAGTEVGTAAPLIVRNTIPYGGTGGQFGQFLQLWQNSTGSNIVSLRADGSLFVGSISGQAINLSGVGTNSTTANMITRTGQGGTGISILSGHQITFSSNSNERMRLDSNGNLVIGSTSAGARLDVRAQGALSTDIAFRVRNSADTANLFNVNGDGSFRFNNNGIVAGTLTVSSTFEATSAFNFIGGTGSTGGKTLRIGSTGGLGVDGASTNSHFSGFLRVGSGGNVDASAVLECISTARGFLPPRMTTTQRNAIASPAAGLIIYNTTDNKHQGYDGTTWNALY